MISSARSAQSRRGVSPRTARPLDDLPGIDLHSDRDDRALSGSQSTQLPVPTERLTYVGRPVRARAPRSHIVRDIQGIARLHTPREAGLSCLTVTAAAPRPTTVLARTTQHAKCCQEIKVELYATCRVRQGMLLRTITPRLFPSDGFRTAPLLPHWNVAGPWGRCAIGCRCYARRRRDVTRSSSMRAPRASAASSTTSGARARPAAYASAAIAPRKAAKRAFPRSRSTSCAPEHCRWR